MNIALPDNQKQCSEGFCSCGVLEHPRYFPRQVITPTELTLEHTYFRDKLRRHNRLLHGWGVVCGAKVCPLPVKDGTDVEAWKVRIEPGYILGPYGDEILIGCQRVVDLRTPGVSVMCEDPNREVIDPWCSDVFERRTGGVLFVAVKYEEIQTRPVRVQPMGCGCDDTPCEYSRFCDGYQIGILTSCPTSHAGTPHEKEIFGGRIIECPSCPDDPWVVLASVDIDDRGSIKSIDNCYCRRIIVSFGSFWMNCERVNVRIKGVSPPKLEIGTVHASIKLSGENFKSGAKVFCGSGLSLNDLSVVSDTEITLNVDVDKTASPGPATIRVVNPDCSTASCNIEVLRKEEKRSLEGKKVKIIQPRKAPPS